MREKHSNAGRNRFHKEDNRRTSTGEGKRSRSSSDKAGFDDSRKRKPSDKDGNYASDDRKRKVSGERSFRSKPDQDKRSYHDKPLRSGDDRRKSDSDKGDGFKPAYRKRDDFKDSGFADKRKSGFDRKKSDEFGSANRGEKRYGDKRFSDNRSDDRRSGDKRFGDKRFSDNRSDDKRSGDKRFRDERSYGFSKEDDRFKDDRIDNKRVRSGDTSDAPSRPRKFEKNDGSSISKVRGRKFENDFEEKPAGRKRAFETKSYDEPGPKKRIKIKKKDGDFDEFSRFNKKQVEELNEEHFRPWDGDSFGFDNSDNEEETKPVNRTSRKPTFSDKAKGYKSGYAKDKKRKSDPGSSDDGSIRLNRYLAHAGVASRREADDLIEAGSVKINGKVVDQLGAKVYPGDRVEYGGQGLKPEKHVYLLLNKPKDFITTVDDPDNRKTVMSLVANACRERIYPVGRLDRNTTGLLLFTNDGDLAKKLSHPSSNIEKMYHVVLDKPLSKADKDKIASGIRLEDGIVQVDQIEYVSDEGSKRELGVVLHSGKNRVVRRLFEALEYQVEKLDRVAFAGLTKKDLPRGRYRFLSEKEVSFLKTR